MLMVFDHTPARERPFDVFVVYVTARLIEDPHLWAATRPTAIIPPYWHRHPELVWELSALHLHWLGAYDPEQNGSAPNGWHADFAATRDRLRDLVAASGSKLDRDRPTRQTIWPGEDPTLDTHEVTITNRNEEFVQFVRDDVMRRRAAEDAFYADLDAPDEPE